MTNIISEVPLWQSYLGMATAALSAITFIIIGGLGIQRTKEVCHNQSYTLFENIPSEIVQEYQRADRLCLVISVTLSGFMFYCATMFQYTNVVQTWFVDWPEEVMVGALILVVGFTGYVINKYISLSMIQSKCLEQIYSIHHSIYIETKLHIEGPVRARGFGTLLVFIMTGMCLSVVGNAA